MAARRFQIQTPARTARLEVEAPFFVVGRGEPYSVFREDPDLAREHFAVVEAEGGHVLKDLGAPAGVTLNGRRLARYEEAPLRPGDTVAAAGTTLVLLGEGEATEGEAVSLAVADAAPAPAEAPDALEGEATLELDAPASSPNPAPEASGSREPEGGEEPELLA